MEIKAFVLLQVLLDCLLGGILLWGVWGRWGRPARRRALASQRSSLQREMERWEKASSQLVSHMQEGIRRLQEMADDLDRAEIRAAETLRGLSRLERGWSPGGRRYEEALVWMDQGVELGEISRRTGIGLDELRLIRHLGSGLRRAG